MRTADGSLILNLKHRFKTREKGRDKDKKRKKRMRERKGERKQVYCEESSKMSSIITSGEWSLWHLLLVHFFGYSFV